MIKIQFSRIHLGFLCLTLGFLFYIPSAQSRTPFEATTLSQKSFTLSETLKLKQLTASSESVNPQQALITQQPLVKNRQPTWAKEIPQVQIEGKNFIITDITTLETTDQNADNDYIFVGLRTPNIDTYRQVSCMESLNQNLTMEEYAIPDDKQDLSILFKITRLNNESNRADSYDEHQRFDYNGRYPPRLNNKHFYGPGIPPYFPAPIPIATNLDDAMVKQKDTNNLSIAFYDRGKVIILTVEEHDNQTLIEILGNKKIQDHVSIEDIYNLGFTKKVNCYQGAIYKD